MNKHLCPIALATLALVGQGCGKSAADKARIRLAVSAYKQAQYMSRRNDETMADLQRAIDVIEDDHARAEFNTCKSYLDRDMTYQKMVVLDYEQNLNTGMKPQAAMDKANKDNPRPDLMPMTRCTLDTLPALGQ